MALVSISILAMLSPIVSAQIFHASGLTLTFSPNTSSCETVKNETTGNGVSIYLDSSQIPASDLCIDLKDMFSQNTSTQTGNVNNDAIFADPHFDTLYPKPDHASVNWTSYGGDHYQPEANYSNVWYYQQNATGSVGEGQYAALVVTVFPLEGCEFGTPENLTAERYTCQSGNDGQCNVDHSGIKSVRFFALNQSTAGGCYEFKQYPSSGQRLYASMSMVSALVVLGAAVMLLK